MDLLPAHDGRDPSTERKKNGFANDLPQQYRSSPYQYYGDRDHLRCFCLRNRSSWFEFDGGLALLDGNRLRQIGHRHREYRSVPVR